MRFDVLGRIIHATGLEYSYCGLERFAQRRLHVVFSPGVFEQAPHMHIAIFKGPADIKSRAALQHDVAVGFPNVSVIDVREVLETVQRVLGGRYARGLPWSGACAAQRLPRSGGRRRP